MPCNTTEVFLFQSFKSVFKYLDSYNPDEDDEDDVINWDGTKTAKGTSSHHVIFTDHLVINVYLNMYLFLSSLPPRRYIGTQMH